MPAQQRHSPHLAHPPVKLRYVLEHAAHLLPAQGPIGIFIHHNTLHAFQHLPFEKAVETASGVFGAEPYTAGTAYRERLAKGRIHQADIGEIVNRERNEVILPGRLDRWTLRGTLLLGGQASRGTVREILFRRAWVS